MARFNVKIKEKGKKARTIRGVSQNQFIVMSEPTTQRNVKILGVSRSLKKKK